MTPRKFAILGFGLLLGSAFGFFAANNLRGPTLAAGQATTQSAPAKTAAPLTNAEITQAIATADSRPNDLTLQRTLGLGLAQYAQTQPNAPYLPNVPRLLQRVQTAQPKDHEVTFALGNAYLLLAQRGDVTQLAAARRAYQQLAATNADAQTALALTYYFDRPPRTAKAIKGLREVLQAQPQQVAALAALATILLEVGPRTEAAQLIDRLEAVAPRHPALPQLRTKLLEPVTPTAVTH